MEINTTKTYIISVEELADIIGIEEGFTPKKFVLTAKARKQYLNIVTEKEEGVCQE
ncbi:MAG: hypothetical protein M0P69_19465 [Bacteroidales bacterium]|nr:hypothetical protein [Bacteroidales bacterium]